MQTQWSRHGALALVLAAGGLGGCNLLIGLDDVNIAHTTGAGGADSGSAASGGGSTGATGVAGGGAQVAGSGGAVNSGGGAGGSGGCAQDLECEPPKVCDVALGVCVAASCQDQKLDGDETGLDCGGSVCPACADGMGCVVAADCVSGVCNDTCLAPTCSDSTHNGDESDLDCGGSCAKKCGTAQGCAKDGDCESQKCEGGTDKKCAMAVCHDGVVSGGEQCDDGNGLGGDGCSGTCQVEAGYACEGAPSLCAPICGDVVLKGDEQCDDGNEAAGDGCSELCRVEPLFQCTAGAPSSCIQQETRCGDGTDNDGDALVDGADPDCALPGYFPWPPCAKYRVYRSINAPKNIPDGASYASSPIVVPDVGVVAHLALLLDITHPRSSDLDVTLIPPSGVLRDVTSGNGGLGANYTGSVFDSGCQVSVQTGLAPFGDCFKPESFLPTSGQTSGIWMLRVTDHAAGNIGMLDGWTLVLCLQ